MPPGHRAKEAELELSGELELGELGEADMGHVRTLLRSSVRASSPNPHLESFELGELRTILDLKGFQRSTSW